MVPVRSHGCTTKMCVWAPCGSVVKHPTTFVKEKKTRTNKKKTLHRTHKELFLVLFPVPFFCPECRFFEFCPVFFFVPFVCFFLYRCVLFVPLPHCGAWEPRRDHRVQHRAIPVQAGKSCVTLKSSLARHVQNRTTLISGSLRR